MLTALRVSQDSFQGESAYQVTCQAVNGFLSIHTISAFGAFPAPPGTLVTSWIKYAPASMVIEVGFRLLALVLQHCSIREGMTECMGFETQAGSHQANIWDTIVEQNGEWSKSVVMFPSNETEYDEVSWFCNGGTGVLLMDNVEIILPS